MKEAHNSGREIDEQKLTKLRARISEGQEQAGSSRGIGLVNIQQRLFAFYGKDFQLTIESEQGKGTTVTIPLRLPKDFGR